MQRWSCLCWSMQLFFFFFFNGEVGVGGGAVETRQCSISERMALTSAAHPLGHYRCVCSHITAAAVGGVSVSLQAWPGNKETKRSLNHKRHEGSHWWTHLNTEVRGRLGEFRTERGGERGGSQASIFPSPPRLKSQFIILRDTLSIHRLQYVCNFFLFFSRGWRWKAHRSSYVPLASWMTDGGGRGSLEKVLFFFFKATELFFYVASG